MVVRESTAGNKSSWLPRLLLVVLVLATHLPFLHQAYHIDDRIYLDVARNILNSPLYPYDFDALYEGFVAPDAASHSHLPLTSYYLALLEGVTGHQTEWIAHLAFMVFPLIAVMAFYELAAKLVRYPLLAATLLLSSMPFLVLSHTIMPDIPLIAFWILALAAFHHFLSNPRSKWAWRVSLFAVLAAGFLSLLTAGLLFLLAVDWYLQRRGGLLKEVPLRRLLWVLALPLLLWFLWYLRAYVHYDRFVLVNTFLHAEQRSPLSLLSIGSKSLNFLLHLGGTFLFPLASWLALAKGRSRRTLLVIFFLIFVPVYYWAPDWRWIQACLLSIFLATAILILFRFLQASRRLARKLLESRTGDDSEGLAPQPADLEERPRSALACTLFLWFWGILAACSLIFYSGSVRYAVLALPAFLLLWQWIVEKRHTPSRGLQQLLLALLLTLPFSLFVAARDYSFADVYRQNSRALMSEYSDSGRVWYAGEWGFRYYMEKSGATPLTKTGTDPESGDIIIKPFLALPWVTLYDSHEYVTLVEQRHVSPDSALRLLDFYSAAGFYSTAWGILPFSLTLSEDWEWFNVFEVKRRYDGPVPEPERPW